MSGVLPAVIILGAVAMVAISMRRLSPAVNAAERNTAARMLAIATGAQGLHFFEEFVTGFDARFPALFGLPPMPQSIFVAFNLLWIGIWLVSIPGLRHSRPVAFFAAWFLAIAGALNGVAHPLLAVVAGGYFPGLFTSPIIGIAGVLLFRKLINATREESVAGTSA